jgi:16S rRNA (adenine(1408)-N(1))-methyltransferase
MGTGDGLFTCRCAREQPERFFIGIDANSRPLEKISEKIHRKPAKGGLSNLLFVQSAVEDLPSDLDGLIEELYVNLPWGSLLAAVAGTNDVGLTNLRRICVSGAIMRVNLALDVERDVTVIKRWRLPAFSIEYIDATLTGVYRNSGFELVERDVWTGAERGKLQTSWAKRLRLHARREVVSIIARAI